MGNRLEFGPHLSLAGILAIISFCTSLPCGPSGLARGQSRDYQGVEPSSRVSFPPQLQEDSLHWDGRGIIRRMVKKIKKIFEE